MPLSTINQQSEETFNNTVASGEIFDSEGNEISQEIRQFTQAQTKKDLELFLAEILPEKMKMRHAIKTHSDAGAGHTIGHNSCIYEIRQRAKYFLNN